MSIEKEKRLVAEAAAAFVKSGMVVGLGTGSTVDFLLPPLARRHLSIRCVASSPRTEHLARELGLNVVPFDQLDQLDLVIDGADQIAPDGWLVKGAGAAHTREKIVAASGTQFIVIADSRKPVPALHAPVPVELLSFGLSATLRRLQPIQLRDIPRSPDGGIIADYLGKFADPAELATWLEATPGLVSHGLFPPALVTEAWIARNGSIERTVFKPSSTPH